jgi:hypothetical protein
MTRRTLADDLAEAGAAWRALGRAIAEAYRLEALCRWLSRGGRRG